MQYRFYVVARNVVGVSVSSAVIHVLAATAPDTLQHVAVHWRKHDVQLQWQQPHNNGADITDYLLTSNDAAVAA